MLVWITSLPLILTVYVYGYVWCRFAGRYEVNVLSESPWVVTIDNFLSDKEVAAIIRYSTCSAQ